MMTVGELIDELRKQPAKAEVWIITGDVADCADHVRMCNGDVEIVGEQ